MTFLAAARDLLQDVITANKPWSGRPIKTSKHTDDVQRRDFRRNPCLSASGSSRELLHQMYRAPPEEGPEDTKSMCYHQNYPDSTYEEEASPICFEISSRKC